MEPQSAACRLKLDQFPTVYYIPHLDEWIPDLKKVPNLIPQHEDSWETNEFTYNMEISDNDGIFVPMDSR